MITGLEYMKINVQGYMARGIPAGQLVCAIVMKFGKECPISQTLTICCLKT